MLAQGLETAEGAHAMLAEAPETVAGRSATFTNGPETVEGGSAKLTWPPATVEGTSATVSQPRTICAIGLASYYKSTACWDDIEKDRERNHSLAWGPALWPHFLEMAKIERLQ